MAKNLKENSNKKENFKYTEVKELIEKSKN